MLVVLDDDCLLHNPPYETLSGFRIPYYESPARYLTIRDALQRADDKFTFMNSDPDIEIHRYISSTHQGDYIEYIEKAYAEWVNDGGNPDGVMPDTFFHHKIPRFTTASSLRPISKAGSYCFDLSTPITADTFKSATAAVRVALTAARQLITYGNHGADIHHPCGIFALTRPPGHHAGSSICGGYCYFNNVAVAARFLQSQFLGSASASPANHHLPTIAILDIDYHHGNGTQEIFYEDPDVLYVSIHASEDYPYFTGFPEERGSGKGFNYNVNIPLPRGGITGDTEYCNALLTAISRICEYNPTFLLVSLGVDTFKDDPISDFKLTREGYARVGKAISSIRKPTLFVMEGGYDLPTIGDNVKQVLEGFMNATTNDIVPERA